jgi:hypothetical protein
MLTIGKDKMTTTFVEPSESLLCPAPFQARDAYWFPVRAICEAAGYEVLYYPLAPSGIGEQCCYVEINMGDVALCFYYDNTTSESTAYIEDYAKILPVMLKEGRLYAAKEFFTDYLGFSYSCNAPVVVFGLRYE